MSQVAVADFGLWELAVLAVLREHPLHPYEIQRLLKERRKDDVLVLKRGSLYHAISRLAAAGLIVEGETSRAGLRPERTTYALTAEGEAALGTALRELVAAPRAEASSFMGAMSFLIHLDPAAAATALEERLVALDREIADFDERIATVGRRIGRIHVVESEYARAMRVAEAKWARSLLADLRSGALTWDLKAILRQLKAVHEARGQAVKRRPRSRTR
jgi:DNA-binding PadR family transcriptional regulator